METFNFTDPNGRQALCGFTIDINSESTVSVTITELKENTGMSVTNQFEFIATKVYHRFLTQYDPHNIIWLERYEASTSYSNSGKTDFEIIDLVSLHWNGNQYISPSWQRLVDKKYSY